LISKAKDLEKKFPDEPTVLIGDSWDPMAREIYELNKNVLV
jgi:hypothetical protein